MPTISSYMHTNLNPRFDSFERTSLLGSRGSESERSTSISYNPDSLYRNFYAMSISFAISHGCVVACIAYASTMLGSHLGSVTNGILYIGFTVSAFLMSKPIVNMIGSHTSLILGTIGYCIYVAGFLIAILGYDIFADIGWTISTITSVIGGIAGGLLWTAQGRYFAKHCKLFSETTSINIETVSADFAGLFASVFLWMELMTKVLPSVTYLAFGENGPFIIILFYAIISFGNCFLMGTLDDLGDTGTWVANYISISRDAGDAARLVYNEPRLSYLLPFQVAFGFASSFVPYYIFGTVVSGSVHLGPAYVGLFSALIDISGALISTPAAKFANKYNKLLVIIIGGCCFVVMGFSFLVLSDDALGHFIYIVPVLILYGVGRGIWENTNRAVISDFFNDEPDKCTSAFSATSFFNGYAASMAYFSFPYVTRQGMAYTITISALFSILCYQMGFRLHNFVKSAKSIDKKAILQQQYLAHISGKNVDISSLKELGEYL